MESYGKLGLVAFVLSIVSLCLPWAEIRSVLLSTAIYGFATDGVLSFILLLIAFILMVVKWSRAKAWIALVLSIVALSFPLEMLAVAEEFVGFEKGVYVGYGPGIFLMIVAILMMIVSSIMMVRYKPSAVESPE